MDARLPRLTTAETAARLSVKPSTLYAYVSRGLITRVRDDHGGSSFDALEVEALAAAHRRSAGAGTPGYPLGVLDSALTRITSDGLWFRGTAATTLASRMGFEQAAQYFWTGETDQTSPAFRAPAAAVEAARAASDRLGPAAHATDSLALVVLITASHDPFRRDLSPLSVQAAARTMIAAMADALPPSGRVPPSDASIARRLWSKLSALTPSDGDIALIESALVLGMDHDLAVSTLAARTAASARSDPYLSVGAALNAIDGPLHGSASALAGEAIRETLETGRAETALAHQVAKGNGTPGFGHLIYRHVDPRAAHLLDVMRAIPRYGPALHAVALLSDAVAERMTRPPNVDLALAAIVEGASMRRDAGQILFAVARTVGWIAHIGEEYAETPLRLRPRSRYTGRSATPRPPSSPR
jgi:citrate synthase